MKYDPSTNFSTGLFLDVILPRNHGKWSINNELLFSSYKVSGQRGINSTEIGYSYLKLNNMVRFKYPVGNLFVYVNAGLSNGFAISETNNKKLYALRNGSPLLTEQKALNDTRKFENGWIFGIGAKHNRFSFEVRYENGNGMSEYQTLSSSTKRYYFLLGYRF